MPANDPRHTLAHGHFVGHVHDPVLDLSSACVAIQSLDPLDLLARERRAAGENDPGAPNLSRDFLHQQQAQSAGSPREQIHFTITPQRGRNGERYAGIHLWSAGASICPTVPLEVANAEDFTHITAVANLYVVLRGPSGVLLDRHRDLLRTSARRHANHLPDEVGVLLPRALHKSGKCAGKLRLLRVSRQHNLQQHRTSQPVL